jgi:hypothetical protein
LILPQLSIGGNAVAGENKIEQEYKMQMQKMKSQKEVDEMDFEEEES